MKINANSVGINGLLKDGYKVHFFCERVSEAHTADSYFLCSICKAWKRPCIGTLMLAVK